MNCALDFFFIARAHGLESKMLYSVLHADTSQQSKLAEVCCDRLHLVRSSNFVTLTFCLR